MVQFSPNRRQSLALLPAALLAGEALSAQASEKAIPFEAITPIDGGLRLTQGAYLVDLYLTDKNCLSVIKYPRNTPVPYGFFLNPAKLKAKPSYKAQTLSYGALSIRINEANGSLEIAHKGRVIITDLGGESQGQFVMADESDLYGLGQFRDPLVNYRNQSVYLAQGNMDAINPVLISPKGFSLLWDTGTESHFSSSEKRLEFTNPSPVARYHLMFGEKMDELIASYRRLTGGAPMLPKYTFGFWQSQETYKTQDQLMAILDGYRARKLPLDVMVQDWSYWGDASVFSALDWDKKRFPDPKAMCDHVHKHNAHIICSIWPAFGPETPIYKELDAGGHLFAKPHWCGGKVLDISAPKAQAIYWRYIKEGILSKGMDGLWTDGVEPEFLSTGSRYVTSQAYLSNGQSHQGPIKDHSLTFSYIQAKLLYTNLRALRPTKRPFLLTRSVYAGQQAFNAITWSGDIFAGWVTLRNQIICAQQISLSGIPYWTNDIGAFLITHRFPEGLADITYRELYVRWFQFVAFLSIFRAHGTEIRREIWAMGEKGEPHYEALKHALELRYALMPTIYSLAAKITHDHDTMIRPLIMDYAHDARIKDYSYLYMFGRDILVCPVTTPLLHTQVDPYEFIPNYAVKGLKGPAAEVAFYEGANFEKLVETRLSDDLKMSWFGDLPVELKGKPYSAIWKGTITAEESGRHKWRIITQGLIRFSLEGQIKVASAGTKEAKANGATGAVSFAGHKNDEAYLFEMDMVAGQAYEFELTQSQSKPDAVSLWVEWITPSHAKDMTVSSTKSFEAYLPKGADWYAFGKTKKLKGGQVLKLRPKLDELPLFVRAGSIIAQSPGILHTGETPKAIELHIYPGKNGLCELYEDEGDGFGYEKGAYSLLKIRWDDKKRTLSFAKTQGRYPKQQQSRTFTLILYTDKGTVRKNIAVSASLKTTVSF